MALSIEKEYPNGTTANYHRIVGVHEVVDLGRTSIDVASYVSDEVRQANPGAALERKVYRVDALDVTRAEAYEHLKALDAFAGAEDV